MDKIATIVSVIMMQKAMHVAFAKEFHHVHLILTKIMEEILRKSRLNMLPVVS